LKRAEDSDAFYGPANENVARMVAYFGSYLLWGSLGLIAAGILVFA
jgi:hypothetical protein